MMRALVLSDIHGEESQLRWMLEETWKMTGKIDGYFFLGDGVDDFAQAENFIRRRDPDALMLDVRGNNDFCCPNAPTETSKNRPIINFFIILSIPILVLFNFIIVIPGIIS